MIAVVIIIYLFPTPQLFNLLLFTQSLPYFKTRKFKSVPEVSLKKLCTLDLNRLREASVLIPRDNRFHIMRLIIFIENLWALVLAKIGLKVTMTIDSAQLALKI